MQQAEPSVNIWRCNHVIKMSDQINAPGLNSLLTINPLKRVQSSFTQITTGRLVISYIASRDKNVASVAAQC